MSKADPLSHKCCKKAFDSAEEAGRCRKHRNTGRFGLESKRTIQNRPLTLWGLAVLGLDLSFRNTAVVEERIKSVQTSEGI